MLDLAATADGFTLSIAGRVLLRHTPQAPCLFVGHGEARMEMYRGNFDIADDLDERAPLRRAAIDGRRIAFAEAEGRPPRLVLHFEESALRFEAQDPAINRFWLRVLAEPDEHVWGGGEQMSYLDLSGRRFPLWTSEPGVGRDKTTEITFKADVSGRAGGDYYTTNYPQPTWLSSRRYALHVATTAWSAFDFRHPGFHEIEVWEVPQRIELFAADTLSELVSMLSQRFGRQPPLPEWVYQGAIIGLKDGENSFTRFERIRAAGVKVSGLWCEDWAGVRNTSFGTRLFWDWQASEAR